MPPRPAPTQNRILATLDAEVQTRLFPHLELVELKPGHQLHAAGEALRDIYFPVDSVIALVLTGGSGSGEISLIGQEGAIGVMPFLGDAGMPIHATAQTAGAAYRLPGERLREEFERNADLFIRMLRYSQALITQMAQTAACKRLHTIDQQICRWLLLSMDRLSTGRLTIGQALMTTILGVSAEDVERTNRKLRKAAVIDYKDGQIRVIDRPALEKLSCECYAVVKREEDRLADVASRKVAA